jgi:hypothetical protein
VYMPSCPLPMPAPTTMPWSSFTGDPSPATRLGIMTYTSSRP